MNERSVRHIQEAWSVIERDHETALKVEPPVFISGKGQWQEVKPRERRLNLARSFKNGNQK